MTNDQTVTQALEPCPLCGAPADEPREEQGHHNDGWWLVCCSSCDLQLPRNWSKEAAITAWNTRTAHSGEGRKNDKPPSHWAANDKCDRHPQSAEEWDWHADSPGEDSFERSIKRLNFAVDRGDPDAPNQMALVLRVDLSRVLGRLVHYTAHRELLMQKQTGEVRSNGAGEDGDPSKMSVEMAELFGLVCKLNRLKTERDDLMRTEGGFSVIERAADMMDEIVDAVPELQSAFGKVCERERQLLAALSAPQGEVEGLRIDDSVVELLEDIEDEWIDHYLRPDSAERAKCKRCGGDDFFKGSIEHKPGCLVGRIRAALAQPEAGGEHG